jgi:hypothetical protein
MTEEQIAAARLPLDRMLKAAEKSS